MCFPTRAASVRSLSARAGGDLGVNAPKLFGILNITEDSFSDGGQHLDPAIALAAARRLAAQGADVVDLGAAASNIAAKPVAPEEEIRRLAPIVAALQDDGVAVSVDSFAAETQRFAMQAGVAFLNDIQGFPDPSLYPELAGSSCRLVVMHAVQGRGRAQRVAVPASEIWSRIEDFFAGRVAALESAGIARDRLILDPGMGFFLSSEAATSLTVLAGLDRLKRAFGLPVLVSVSRKSFLGALIGRTAAGDLGPATLAAELFTAASGADYIRTHDPQALRDALTVTGALRRAAIG
jgi:dihydropteroate synthase type 2